MNRISKRFEDEICRIVGVEPRPSIDKLERDFMKREQVDCPVTHHFGPGVCIREVKLPAGAIVIGHHQNFAHLNIFIQGRVSIRNDDGTFTELSAPATFVGKPGRKIGYVHEDVIWQNVWVTDERDIEKIESHFLKKSDTWNESVAAREICKQLQCGVDRTDFIKMLEDLDLSSEEVRSVSVDESDMIELPYGSYKFKVAPSKIEGQGLIAIGDIAEDEFIAPARLGDNRTVAGRFTNHSLNPNAKMIVHLGNIYLVATKSIKGCKGGLDGEEITIDYRAAYRLNISIAKERRCLASQQP